MKARVLTLTGIALIALAGCGGSSQPSASSSGAVPTSLVEAAKCMRENGYPTYPDPVRFDGGNWGFPDSAPNVDPPEACRQLFINGKNQQDTRPGANNPQYMAQARKYAECMRAHNLPDWPDPDSDGYFHPADNLVPKEAGDSPASKAREACRSEEPPGGVLTRPAP